MSLYLGLDYVFYFLYKLDLISFKFPLSSSSEDEAQ